MRVNICGCVFKHEYSGAYITKHHYQLKKDDLLDQRAKLHDKIMHLYAPMVGNRLVHSMAVKSFEDKHKMPIEDFMKLICEKVIVYKETYVGNIIDLETR